MTEQDLLLPELSLKAANTSGIDIVGALFVEISGKDVSGLVRKTRQICYIAKGVKEQLLSKKTCEKLGMIPARFPIIGAFDSCVKVVEVKSDTPVSGDPVVLPDICLALTPCSPDSKSRCSCPRRSLPP